jgi:5'-nucleotidase
VAALPRLRLAVIAVACVLVAASRPGEAQPPGRDFTLLLSNDDGFDAPGLQALIAVFAGTADLYVSAPSQNQSGKGHSISIGDPLIVRQRSVERVSGAYAVDGTPAMALRVGLEAYLPRRPDLVISGINRGENIGTSVYVSGTVGAAREAVISGIPAMAVSMAGNRTEDYAATAAFTKQLVGELRAKQMLKPGFFLNVNAPSSTPKGAKVTRLSVQGRRWQIDCTAFVRDRAVCVPESRRATVDEPGTDVEAFGNGYITITPLTLDETDVRALDAVRALEQVAAGASR